MKRSLLTLAILAGTSLSLSAAPVFMPAGESLTYGDTGNHQSLQGYTNNPATGATSLGMTSWNFGMGIISSVGVGYEVGPVDSMSQQIDDLNTAMSDFTSGTPSIDKVNNIKNQFDDFLVEAGDKGYIGLNVALQVPFLPIVWSSAETLGGSLVFDSNVGVQAKLSILDSPIVYNPLGATPEEQLQTNTAAYIKLGAISETSLGYSRPVFEHSNGQLYAGLRAKYYQVGLTKTLVGISQMASAETAINDKVKDVQNNFQPDTGVGVDLGVMWVAPSYRVGATFKNVNSPSFNYDTVGVDCAAKTGAAADSCYIAKAYADEIDTEEKYVMDAQVTVEGAFYNSTRNMVLNFSADTSPVHDPVANDLQWMSVSAAYASNSWIIPGVRVGYRKNMAGSQLSAATAGLTLFNILHLDAAYGLETIDVDGTPQPRMAQVNLGLDLLF